jgi:RNA polymerase sigma-70 factor (ECF subfamily)
MTWTTEDGRSGGEPGETHLLEGCKKGDRTAQRKLFDALAPKMMALCLRYTGDSQTAEDVLQDGFVTLFTRLDSYSGKGSFEGWARKIFVNAALMQLRKNDALSGSDDIDAARSLSSGAPTAVEDLGYREIMKLIASLPDGLRTVFNMYVIEGYTHKEIGEALGMEEATSRSKLQRARVRLQELIRENK